MEEKDKKVIIIGAVVVIIIAVIAVVMMRQPAEDPVVDPMPFPVVDPAEEPAEEPVVEKPVFEPDETIPAEFCRRVITRAQLREITGYEGVFSFEEEIIERDPFVGSDVKTCDIRTAVTLGEFDPSLEIAIISPVVDYTVEEQFIEIKNRIIILGKDVREIEGIGEKAFLFLWTFPEREYILSFIDADIDRIVFAGVSMLEFDYEVALNFAKQVEANLRE